MLKGKQFFSLKSDQKVDKEIGILILQNKIFFVRLASIFLQGIIYELLLLNYHIITFLTAGHIHRLSIINIHKA